MSNLICLDVETTGVDFKENSIVSLGAIDFNSDKSFYGECCIYDDTKITQIALEINGFTEAEIRDKTKIPAHELYYNFQEWAQSIIPEDGTKIVLVGHNIGHFDILFLEELSKMIEHHRFPFSYRTVDSHTLGVALFGESLSLDGVGEKFGLLKEPKPHNALTGAKYCKEVVKMAFERIAQNISSKSCTCN